MGSPVGGPVLFKQIMLLKNTFYAIYRLDYIYFQIYKWTSFYIMYYNSVIAHFSWLESH